MTRETSSRGTAAAGRAERQNRRKGGGQSLQSRNEEMTGLTAFADPDPLEVVLEDDRVLPVVHLRVGQDALVLRLEVLADKFPQDVEPETACWRESDFDLTVGTVASRQYVQVGDVARAFTEHGLTMQGREILLRCVAVDDASVAVLASPVAVFAIRCSRNLLRGLLRAVCALRRVLLSCRLGQTLIHLLARRPSRSRPSLLVVPRRLIHFYHLNRIPSSRLRARQRLERRGKCVVRNVGRWCSARALGGAPGDCRRRWGQFEYAHIVSLESIVKQASSVESTVDTAFEFQLVAGGAAAKGQSDVKRRICST